MHELTLVQGILDSVKEIEAKEGKKAVSCRIGVGELAQFDEQLLRTLFADLAEGVALRDMDVVFEHERAKILCKGCGRAWGFKDLAGQLTRSDREMVHFLPELLGSFAKCPGCSKSYFEIEGGRSVRVIEVSFHA